ncbi:bifunctional phosphatase PAP2/diacylglycerol kinase family protein [Microlunatus antarcticus]|uniref:YegS/Rv2252/BmrU family lipid kinase n=1 Tax=Microlunatus antarcticus TaxID=53388 RepID=A0A7W5JYX1_9ACTN|nr:diacylglycerol kinase family protein [Microlunatus antarcticus]MBB3328859.1 YegS/Rv2252/BmrU family lipid kinase [Microlunatus antarcticus]
MVRRTPSLSAVSVAVVLGLAFVVWTGLVLAFPPVARADRLLLAPTLTPGSALAQISAAFSLLTYPGLVFAAVAGLAVWAWQRRLRQLCLALVLMIVLGWGGYGLVKLAVRRARPERALDVLTATGYAYPSGHLTAIVCGTIAVGAAMAVSRRPVRARFAWQVAAIAIVALVALDRWITSAHWISDLVGGALFGGLVATVSLLLAGVHVPLPHDFVTEIARSRVPRPDDHVTRRAAVIYNPAKVVDWVTFRRQVEYELKTRGWERTLFLETTPEDSGHAMTAYAVREGVDLVLGAGGDGTVRVICSGLADTGIPFGLIPAGTGNLLAKNIGIPLDAALALDVALDGEDKPIDLVGLTIDGHTRHTFAVMAGIGVDAAIMESTNADLKKAVGSAAYFVAAAQNANHKALLTRIQVDDGEVVERLAHVIVVGNVGFLQGNLPLIPDARPDDGLLDVLIASPVTFRDWARVFRRVVTRRHREDAQLDRFTGRKVTITVDRRDAYQLDGDTAGDCRTLTAEVRPGALVVRVPREAATPRATSAELVEVGAAAEPQDRTPTAG